MVKRLVVLVAVVFAVAVPSALADTGAPPAPASASGGGGGGTPQLQQRLQNVRRHVLMASVAFRHCVVRVADAAKCTDAANRMLSRLQKVDGRVGDLISRIEQRAGHDDAVTVVQNVQQHIHELEQKLQDWLANPPSGGSSTTTSTGDSASAGSDGLEPIDQLGSDLAAARSAAQQSGIKE
jgi:hypothetical protein